MSDDAPASATLEAPALNVIEPDTADIGDGQFIMAVRGTGFTMHSQVFFGDEGMPTGMLAPDLLAVPVTPGLWFEATSFPVSVKTGEHLTTSTAFTLTDQEKQDAQEQE